MANSHKIYFRFFFFLMNTDRCQGWEYSCQQSSWQAWGPELDPKHILKKKNLRVWWGMYTCNASAGAAEAGKGHTVSQSNLPYLGNSRPVRCAVSKTKTWTMHTHIHIHACMHAHTHRYTCMHAHMWAYTHFHVYSRHTKSMSLFPIMAFSGASEQHITLCLWGGNTVLFPCFPLHSFFSVCTYLRIFISSLSILYSREYMWTCSNVFSLFTSLGAVINGSNRFLWFLQ